MKHSKTLHFWIVLALLTWLGNRVTGANYEDPTEESHSRQKRMLWPTGSGGLALPPGTQLTVSLSLTGVLSPMTITLPFTIDFDALGMTDKSNPFGNFPLIFGRSMGRTLSSIFTDYIGHFTDGKRSTRSVSSLAGHSRFPGGERAQMYTIVEDLFTSFGMDGKACLLRTICEIHKNNIIYKFGFVGEILQLFLTASQSNYADSMEDYVAAENVGKINKECYPYFKECPRSLFTGNKVWKKDFTFDDDEDDSLDVNFDDTE